jgi:sugar diacid utilization regulator
VASVAAVTDVDIRDQLSSLQGLVVLSMLMAERADEHQILHLAATSVPSLGTIRVDGMHLLDGGWRITTVHTDQPGVRADLERQLRDLGAAGGALATTSGEWAWAYPLRSLEGHFGYLVVGAPSEPSGDKQFLVRVLAQQTGIALATARLHARDRAIAAELRLANDALAETVAALERKTAIHERLTRVSVNGEGQEGIASAVHELTGFPVAVEDQYGNLRAWAGPNRPEAYEKDDPARRERTLSHAAETGQPVRVGDRLIAVARPDHDILGALVLVDPAGRAGNHENVALEHGATVLAVELSRLRGMAETELRLGRDLVEDLLSGSDDEASYGRAQALGYDLARPHRVVIVELSDGGSHDQLFHAVRRAAQDLQAGTLLVGRGRTVVLLADADPSWEALRAAVTAAAGGLPCRLGVGTPAERPAEFPRSYREAQLALRMQLATGSTQQSTAFDELGVYRILAELQDTAAVERFVSQWLSALLDYDEQKGAELVLTLTRYLERGRNHEATASAVGVHRSTLKYRLQRIAEISGHDLGDPETSFNLQLATRAWQTLVALRDGRGAPG